MTSDYIQIILGIVLWDGLVLVARQLVGVHLGGMWEFSGGCLEAGESPRQALARELQEEVGIVVEAASHWMRHGILDWVAMRKRIFVNQQEHKELEAITHPKIQEGIKRQLAEV